MSNDINHSQKGLNECQVGQQGMPNLDPPPPYCGEIDGCESDKREVNDQSLNWLKDTTNQKIGLGAHALCDPMQKGNIINEPGGDRGTIYRYSKSKRGCDDAMQDLFRNIIVIDEDGKAHPVPIIWGTQERAVAAILLDNVRQDETLVVDRIRLPMLAIKDADIQFATNRYVYHKALDYMRYLRPDDKPGFTIREKYDRDTVFGVAKGIPVDITYTLTAWTLYVEDMNQMLEQIITKFSQTAYIRVTGVPWEVIVKLDSIANNGEYEPGDQAIRVIKYEFNLTAETYIPQPIQRKKAVLKTRIEFVDGLEDAEITEVLTRLEESIKELEC